MPIFGFIFSKLLSVMSLTPELVTLMFKKDYEEYVKGEVYYWVYGILIIGGVTFTVNYISKVLFGYVSEGVTLKIR